MFEDIFLRKKAVPERLESYGFKKIRSGYRYVTNLGVHEHWNNSAEKLYSRNLGKDEGIELVSILK